MQNSKKPRIFEFYRTSIFIFFKKIRVAYKLLKAPKSILIINDHIDAFKHDPETIGETCKNIYTGINNFKKQKDQEAHKELVSQATDGVYGRLRRLNPIPPKITNH